MKPWSVGDDATLRDLAAQGFSSREIALAMDRTRNSILGRAKRKSIRIKGLPSKEKPKLVEAIQEIRPIYDLDAMKAEFFAKHGGPRKIEPLAGNRYWHMQEYLLTKGYVLTSRQGRTFSVRNKAGGSARTRSYKQVTDLVDKLRIADGLEPLHVQNRKG